MTAPRWLTDPAPEELGAFAVAILVGSLATNALWKAETMEKKGALLIASGLSTMALMVGVRSLCEKSEKGVCAYVPKGVLP